MGALAAEAERAPREQEAEQNFRATRTRCRYGGCAPAQELELRGASVELRLRASARTCGHRGCAERRRWRERDDDTGAREAPQRRKKREARTRALHKELVLLTLWVLTVC